MKLIRYALVLTFLSCSGLFAATTTKSTKHTKYKKVEAKKQTPAKKATIKSTAKDTYGKPSGSYKKMETKKHEKGLRKPATKPLKIKSVTLDRPEQATATPKKAEPTMIEKAASWLGLGAAGTAATKAIGTHKEAGYHVGPRGWHHNFGPGWGEKGWVEGVNEHGNWVFAGYRPEWWQINYPVYWKDVVGPLYRKSTEYQKTLSK